MENSISTKNCEDDTLSQYNGFQHSLVPEMRNRGNLTLLSALWTWANQ